MKLIEDTCLYYDVIYKLKPMYQDEFQIRYIMFEQLTDSARIPEGFAYRDITYFAIVRSVTETKERMEEVEKLTDIRKYEMFLEPVMGQKLITKALLTLI